MNSNVLFLVSSPYQLFNAIVLSATECKNEECDLVININKELSVEILDKVQSSQLFETIITDISKQTVEIKYDKFFIASPNKEWEMLYRQHVIRGRDVEVCLFDNGYNTYEAFGNDIRSAVEDGYTCFENKVTCGYYYYPQFAIYKEIKTKKIINPFNNLQTRCLIESIYGGIDSLKGMYIYIDNTNKKNFNEDVVLHISDIIGRDRIVFMLKSDEKYEKVIEHSLNYVEKNMLPDAVKIMQACMEGACVIMPDLYILKLPYMYYALGANIIIINRILELGENDIDKREEIDTYINDIQTSDDTRVYTPSSMVEFEELFRYYNFKCDNYEIDER